MCLASSAVGSLRCAPSTVKTWGQHLETSQNYYANGSLALTTSHTTNWPRQIELAADIRTTLMIDNSWRHRNRRWVHPTMEASVR